MGKFEIGNYIRVKDEDNLLSTISHNKAYEIFGFANEKKWILIDNDDNERTLYLSHHFEYAKQKEILHLMIEEMMKSIYVAYQLNGRNKNAVLITVSVMLDDIESALKKEEENG